LAVLLKDQTVFITGGASGIGRAVARQIAAAGGRVGICDRDGTAAAAVSDEINSAGGRAAHAAADVRQMDQIQSAVAILESALGAPSGVLACAGVSQTTLLDQLSAERDELLFQVNLLGVARTLEASLPGLKRHGRGWFGGVSSLVALRGLPFTAAYCGSKSGVAEYLEGLRPWLAREGVDLTVIYPGYVKTPLTDKGAVKPPIKALEPEQAASHIVTALQRRQPVCAFPRGMAFALRLMRCLPARTYDRVMTNASRSSPHLKY